MLTLPLAEFSDRFGGAYGGKTRVFRASYWRIRGMLRVRYRLEWSFDPATLSLELASLAGLQQALAASTDYQADDVRIRPLIERAHPNLTRARFEIDYLKSLFQPSAAIHDRPEVSFANTRRWLDERRNALDQVAPYLRFAHTYDEAVALGLQPFVDSALRHRLPVYAWPHAYEKAFLERWLDQASVETPELAFFTRETHEKTIERFRELDVQQLQIARQRILARAASERPSADAALRYAPTSEISILTREFYKKARIKPLRKLFGEAPNAILAIKPCFMMSPLSVSTFLQPDRFRFDLVIFDEASQVRVEDAIGSIARGKQLVVAGDRQQLPPTRFFDAMTLGEEQDSDDENVSDVYESVLDALGGFLPSRELRWHYRSRNEGLIAFSNKEFYNSRLYTFPHPNQAGADQGLSFIFVAEGVYERGGTRRNVPEARRVVSLLLDHATMRPDLSLAVVTFNEAQREAVQELLNQELAGRTDARAFFETAHHREPFRIKNLELIQGDERDVIVFSLGYGRDESGAPPMLNFGPLNQEGGRRRLNVAVTRARHKILVVSSLQPEDLARSDNEGVRLLREYLFLARDGLSALYTTTGRFGDVESPLEASVLASLRSAGLEAHAQVGVSGYRIDIAIVDPTNPGRYCLGVECDGATYHAARTARDRDRLRQAILEGLGWNIHRIWSHDWHRDPDGELNRALERVRACAGTSSAAIARATVVRTTALTTEGQLAETRTGHDASAGSDLKEQKAPRSQPVQTSEPVPPPGTAYYTAYAGPLRTPNDQLERLVDDFVKIVNAEGPVHIELVFRRMATGWGVSRIGSRIRGQLTVISGEASRRSLVRVAGAFLWPKKPGKLVPRVPREGEERRTTEEISPDELTEAVRLCLRQAYGGLSRADLVTLTVRLFGFQRVTDSLATPVEKVIEGLLAAEEIEDRNGVIQPTPDGKSLL